MSEFKVGDRVKAKESYDNFDGARPGAGTVVKIDACNTALVRFDDWSGGHDGGKGDGREDKWWIIVDGLEPAADERFIIVSHSLYETFSTLAEAEASAAKHLVEGDKYAVCKVVSVASAAVSVQFERFA